jgi:Zn finger protein HypA/HybF involved in hydrogenase expression
MTIKFLCPNGHQLSAPENMAGKKGKCPKCGSAFAVPTLEELAANDADQMPPQEEPVGAAVGAAGSSSAISAGEPKSGNGAPSGTSASGSNLGSKWADDSRPSIAAGSGKGMPKGETFVFLCPNGHKLNGPPSLKGKPGKCPHCGAKFRIPSDEDADEEVPTGEQEEEIPEGQADDDQAGGFNFNFGGQPEEEVIDAAVEEPLAPPPPGAAALGYIVGRLWDNKIEGQELEIYLNEGEIIAPDRFSEILSSCDYGVFGTKEGDGTYSVTVIPWSAVRKIGMRKIGDLPRDSFR